MPLYNLNCPKCLKTFRKLLLLVALPKAECPECHVLMEREATPPSNTVYESLDNGAMIKRVERLANAEELHKNRDKKEE